MSLQGGVFVRFLLVKTIKCKQVTNFDMKLGYHSNVSQIEYVLLYCLESYSLDVFLNSYTIMLHYIIMSDGSEAGCQAISRCIHASL